MTMYNIKPSKSSTNVYKFFLTLRIVNIVDSSITIDTVFKILTQLLGDKVKLYGVKEFHSDNVNYHFHIVIVRDKGLSKNSYKFMFRDSFHIFSGRGIDVRGIKNITHTMRYILKNVTDLSRVMFYNTNLDEILGMSKISEISIFHDIKKYKDFDTWKRASLGNRCEYYKHNKKVKLIWEDAMSEVVGSLKDVSKMIRVGTNSVDKFTPTMRNLLLTPWVLLFLLKLARVIFFPHEWKRTNLLVSGSPNCGKTSFFKKFEQCFNIELFWGSQRVGDFSGLRPNHCIIILDDIITKDHKWPLPILLKLLGREGLKGDVKISKMVNIKKGVPVAILTNYPRMFLESIPIRARLCVLNFEGRVNWLDMSDHEFKELITFVQDLVGTIKVFNPNFYKNIMYINNTSSIFSKGSFLELHASLKSMFDSGIWENGVNFIKRELPDGSTHITVRSTLDTKEKNCNI